MGARRTRGIGFVICCLAFVLGLHHCQAYQNHSFIFHQKKSAKLLKNMPPPLMLLHHRIRPKPKNSRPTAPTSCCPCESIATCKTPDCPCFANRQPCTHCCPHDNGLCQRIPSQLHAWRSPPTPFHDTVPTHFQAPPAPPASTLPSPPTPRLPNTPRTPRTPRRNSLNLQLPPTPAHATPTNSDLPDFQKSTADELISKLYGDHVHWNDGTHLHGGLDPAKDKLWQDYYNNLSNYLPQHYDLPRGPSAERFLQAYANILHQIVDRAYNSETLLVFTMVILQRKHKVTRNRDVKQLLEHRLREWEAGNFATLVHDCELAMVAHLTQRRGPTTEAERVRRFHHLMLKGEIRRAVRYLTEREKFNVLQPSSATGNENETVIEVLQAKHPKPKSLRAGELPSFPDYPTNPPPFSNLDITEETVAKTAAKLSGACGPGGTDGHTLKSWLLYHRKSSTNLRLAYARFANWQANHNIPWAAIRALQSNRGLALDKFPGVRPIGIGNIERRFIAKCVIAEAGPAATQAAGTTQLAVGLPAGIEGAIHAAREHWDAQADQPDFGFLQIDAKNAFNELDRTMMLYVTRYLWPHGARYAYNCYKHWSVVLFHDPTSGIATKIFSATGVVQGCPLSMYLYSLTTVPLIQRLQREFSSLLHLWYADDGNIAGPFDQIQCFLSRLTNLGKPYGYYVQPSKCQLITRHPDSARYAFEESPLASSVLITTGSRFLGGHIGIDTSFNQWLSDKVQDWAKGIATISTAATSYPQSAYTGLQKSLQQEWQFVQRTCPSPPDSFQPLEAQISKTFIPALFSLPSNHISLPPRPITALPIKKAGLALNNPTTDAPNNYNASKEITLEIVRALIDPTIPAPVPAPTEPQDPKPQRGPFRIADHRTALANGRANAQRTKAATSQTIYEEHHNSLTEQPNGRTLQRRLARCCSTGAWLTARPGILERTYLSAQEWRDGVYLRYGMTPQGLPAICDGCNRHNSTNHALNCPFGGMVIQRHNEIRDELAAITNELFPSSAITLEPTLSITPASTIPTGQHIHHDTPAPTTDLPIATTTPATPAISNRERGDIAIRGLFERGTNAIIDVKLANLDSPSYRSQDPEKVLLNQETIKRQKYKAICETRRESFHPFVASTDGMLAPEATKILQHLAQITAEKQQTPYSAIVKHLRLRISITLVKAAHHCLRESRKKRHLATPNNNHTQPSEPSPDYRMLYG